MKIKPIGPRIQIDIIENTAGMLNLSSTPTAIECGTVSAIGNAWDLEKEPVKVGDKIHYKSWSLDIVTVEGKKYYYLNQNTNGICAVVK